MEYKAYGLVLRIHLHCIQFIKTLKFGFLELL